MTPPSTRLFHLHYHVPDIGHATDVLAAAGLPLHARFGWVDGEMTALAPDEPIPADFRLRLQDSQRGYANVTLTEGADRRFDHLGVVTAEFADVLERAESAGWSVQGEDDVRTFLITPWGFRVEVHPAGDRVEQSLGDWEEGRFESVALTVPTAEEVRARFEAVFEGLPQLRIDGGTDERADVPVADLAGTAVEPSSRVRAAELAP